ncbi:hypothetical protein F5Y18DRAFT_422987 [Xylariaceae sp. FL1019]|nr:hypothetical protein F5Y18DRAFT_422987 [Xylariaceae sp. FL1019]
MCRVGAILMTGCNHVRQTGWEDAAVATHLSALITRCSSCENDQSFCGTLSIDKNGDAQPRGSGRRTSSARHRSSSVQSLSDSNRPLGSLDDKCKFCACYESEICLADHIKQSLMDYNMALLSDDARIFVQAEMDRAFQRAVDIAVRAYGPDGRSKDKAFRTLDSEYQKASAEISRMCGERQLAPYRELYGR